MPIDDRLAGQGFVALEVEASNASHHERGHYARGISLARRLEILQLKRQNGVTLFSATDGETQTRQSVDFAARSGFRGVTILS
jgi:hypothetical protein